MCGVEFVNVFARNAHVKNHASTAHTAAAEAREDAMHCQECGERFDTIAARDDHITRHDSDRGA